MYDQGAWTDGNVLGAFPCVEAPFPIGDRREEIPGKAPVHEGSSERDWPSRLQ